MLDATLPRHGAGGNQLFHVARHGAGHDAVPLTDGGEARERNAALVSEAAQHPVQAHGAVG